MHLNFCTYCKYYHEKFVWINQERELHNSSSTRTQISEFNQWMKLLKKNIFAEVPQTAECHLEMFHFYYQRLKWSIGVFLYQTQLCTEPIVAMTEQKSLVHITFSRFLKEKKCWTTALMPKFKVWGIPFKKLMTQIHNCWPKISRTKQNFSFSHKINSCFQHTLLTSTSGILNTCETFFSLQKYNKISIRISTTWLYQQDREDSLELNYRPMNCI